MIRRCHSEDNNNFEDDFVRTRRRRKTRFKPVSSGLDQFFETTLKDWKLVLGQKREMEKYLIEIVWRYLEILP